MLHGPDLPDAPGLREARQYPITAGIAALAILASLAAWTGIDLPLFFDVRFVVQPWRLVTSVLPHVDVLHLAFNLYWLWAFGTVLERTLGPWRFAALVGVLASVPSAAEYAFQVGGVGLSGVVYGFLAFMWTRRRDERFAPFVRPATVQLFVFWFFLCVVLTVTSIWEVGNVAHAAGAATGGMLGWLRADTARGRRARLVAAGGLAALALAGATVLRPYVNVTPARAADWDAGSGYLALVGGQNAQAAVLLAGAVRLDGSRGPLWFNLGIALHRLGLTEPARQAFERAARREPGNERYRRAADETAARR
jgi:membrane associated rhomboid family serine protease